MEGKPTKKSYKPYITDTEEEEVDLGPEEVALVVTVVKDGPGQKVDSEEEEEDSPIGEDSREENLTKAPRPRGLKYLVKPRTKTKIDAIIAISGDTLQLNAPRKIKVSLRNPLRERSLKIILTPMEVQKNLSWLWPQSCPKLMKRPSLLCDSP